MVGHGFGLGEVYLAVQKGALGKFAGFCRPCAVLNEQFQRELRGDLPAMAVNFKNVLPGIRGWRLEVDAQGLVYHGRAVHHFAQGKIPGAQLRSRKKDPPGHGQGIFAAQPQDGNACAPRRRGDCADGIFSHGFSFWFGDWGRRTGEKAKGFS